MSQKFVEKPFLVRKDICGSVYIFKREVEDLCTKCNNYDSVKIEVERHIL